MRQLSSVARLHPIQATTAISYEPSVFKPEVRTCLIAISRRNARSLALKSFHTALVVARVLKNEKGATCLPFLTNCNALVVGWIAVHLREELSTSNGKNQPCSDLFKFEARLYCYFMTAHL